MARPGAVRRRTAQSSCAQAKPIDSDPTGVGSDSEENDDDDSSLIQKPMRARLLCQLSQTTMIDFIRRAVDAHAAVRRLMQEPAAGLLSEDEGLAPLDHHRDGDHRREKSSVNHCFGFHVSSE